MDVSGREGQPNAGSIRSKLLSAVEAEIGRETAGDDPKPSPTPAPYTKIPYVKVPYVKMPYVKVVMPNE